MKGMIVLRRIALALSLAAAPLAGCREQAPALQEEPAAMPHGDHRPHHGGLVMMKGDLHYEVVFDQTGRDYQVFFTDAVRRDLPASTAADVTLTIARPGAIDETVTLRIDPARNAWVGRGRPVADPDRTSARLAFTLQGGPYWIDLPFTSPAAAGPGL
jgi:hypothetical protein